MFKNTMWFKLLVLSSCFLGLANSQRKVSRNAAVSSGTNSNSDIKQAVDFDCPEEFGYYPHPTDCTQYYVCVFGGALLESCTGGLMYSHELQTCDWPRNVGCDATGTAQISNAQLASSSVDRNTADHSSGSSRTSNTRYTAQSPISVTVSSRGQSRQLQHEPVQVQSNDYNNQYVKQKQHQQQLYSVGESDLPEEIETDRQQRVYRGQPSTVGQVERDRDALRHTNAIPVQSVRGTKIGVISFGTQQQPQYSKNLTEDLLETIDDSATLNRVKRQFRYSRLHGVGHPTKSTRYIWTAGSAPGIRHEYHDIAKGSSNIRPFRPSIPEKPYNPKLSSTFESFPKPSIPVHTILPLIHQNSFDPLRPVQGNGTYSYYNQLPSTILQRPTADETYSYYNTKNQAQTNPFATYHSNPNYKKPQKFETPDDEETDTSKSFAHVGRQNEYNNIVNLYPPTESPSIQQQIYTTTTYKPNPYFYYVDQSSVNQPQKYPTKFTPSKLLNDSEWDNFRYIFNDNAPTQSNYQNFPPKTTTENPNTIYRTTKPPFSTKYANHNQLEPHHQNSDIIYSGRTTESPRTNHPNHNYRTTTETSYDELELTTARSDEHAHDENEPFHDDFTPPPYFYNTHKYENIQNPFADPNFDFDKYLMELSDAHEASIDATTEKAQETQTEQKVDIRTPRPFKSTTTSANITEYSDYDSTVVTSKKPTANRPRKPNQQNNVKSENLHENGPTAIESYYTYQTTHYPIVTSTDNVNINLIKPKYTDKIQSTQNDTKLRNTVPSRRKQNYRYRLTESDIDNDTKVNRLSVDNSYRVEPSTEQYPSRSANIATGGTNGRALYNTTVQNYEQNQYDPYYTLYEDDVELYRDVDYGHNYNTASNDPPAKPQTIYRGTPATPQQSVETATVSSRTPSQYIQQDTLSYSVSPQQSIYKQPVQDDYSDETDVNQYPSGGRTAIRGDRNDLRFPEPTTTKKAVVKTTTTTTTVRPTTSLTTRSANITSSQNGTRPESIFITLTAKPRFIPTPFQTPSSTTEKLFDTSTQHSHVINATKTSETSSTTTPRSRFISLTAAFTLQRQKDSSTTQRNSDSILANATISKPAPFTKTQHDTHADSERPVLPFRITDLPTPETRSVTIKLMSNALGASRGTSQHMLHIRSTESPNKREIYSNTFSKNALDYSTVKNNNISIYIRPTTYSVPKHFLETLFHKTTPPHTQAQTSTQKTKTEFFHFDYYDYPGDENDTRNTIPQIPDDHFTLPPKRTRTKDVVISPEQVQFNNYNIERRPTSTERNMQTNQLNTPSSGEIYNYYEITTHKPFFSKIQEVPSALKSDSDTYDVRTTTTSTVLTPTTIQPTSTISSTPIYTVPSTPKISTTLPTVSYQTPGRVSRINPAIKSITTFRGASGNSKCFGNNTIVSVKCNEINQRTNSRGRGAIHYTNDDIIINRGTPASRSRPTLKPSTSIVSKASEYIDIYKYPPSRPAPVYPTPQVDKSAAKCRKDVCLLPDCYCGGKDIPGDLPVESVPQIVLLTFDDSVNDLNKGLYSDLFEKGRVNPNGCPIAATFYVSHEWTDYSQVQNLYAAGHEIASHTVSHSFGEQFSQKKWNREVGGQREILAAYGGVRLEDVRGMRAPFLSVGGNKMFKMLYDSNFTYDSSMPVYENKPPSWPYTLDYKLFHDCMIPPCPTRSYPGVWEVPMVMWQDLNGGRCSMGDACSNPPAADGVFKMLMKNFDRHYSTNRAPFGLFYHAAWFTQPHHKEGFIQFLDTINAMKDVWLVTNWQAIQWIREPTPISRLANFKPFQCHYTNRPKKCNNPKVCNLWHKSGVRYMRTCQPCPDIYPWTGKTGIKSSRIDNDIDD